MLNLNLNPNPDFKPKPVDRMEVVKILCAQGADVDATDFDVVVSGG